MGDPGGSAPKLTYNGGTMSYHVTHCTGEMVANFPTDRFGELLDELSGADSEHPDISVSHESEWSLSVYKSGFVVLENLEEGEPVHMGPLDRTESVALMVAIADGKLDDVQAEQWQPGYPPRSTG
jgi:hypothetical protein